MNGQIQNNPSDLSVITCFWICLLKESSRSPTTRHARLQLYKKICHPLPLPNTLNLISFIPFTLITPFLSLLFPIPPFSLLPKIIFGSAQILMFSQSAGSMNHTSEKLEKRGGRGGYRKEGMKLIQMYQKEVKDWEMERCQKGREEYICRKHWENKVGAKSYRGRETGRCMNRENGSRMVPWKGKPEERVQEVGRWIGEQGKTCFKKTGVKLKWLTTQTEEEIHLYFLKSSAPVGIRKCSLLPPRRRLCFCWCLSVY